MGYNFLVQDRLKTIEHYSKIGIAVSLAMLGLTMTPIVTVEDVNPFLSPTPFRQDHKCVGGFEFSQSGSSTTKPNPDGTSEEVKYISADQKTFTIGIDTSPSSSHIGLVVLPETIAAPGPENTWQTGYKFPVRVEPLLVEKKQFFDATGKAIGSSTSFNHLAWVLQKSRPAFLAREYVSIPTCWIIQEGHYTLFTK